MSAAVVASSSSNHNESSEESDDATSNSETLEHANNGNFVNEKEISHREVSTIDSTPVSSSCGHMQSSNQQTQQVKENPSHSTPNNINQDQNKRQQHHVRIISKNTVSNSAKNYVENGNRSSGVVHSYTAGSDRADASRVDESAKEDWAANGQKQQAQQTKLVQNSSPLSPDLLRILQEVATTGGSSLLPWQEDGSHITGSNPIISGGNANLSSNNSQSSHDPTATTQHTVHNRSTPHGSTNRLNHYHGIRTRSKRARTSSSNHRRSLGSKHKQVHRFYSTSGSGTTTTTTTTAAPTAVAGQKQMISSAAAAASSSSSRKQYLNGLHTRHPYGSSATSSRKRPLVLVRTTSAPGTSSNIFSPGSVGSGRTSGSEPEDLSQYECDSEGTSATSNSELSSEQGRSSFNEISSIRKQRGLAFQSCSGGRLIHSNPGDDVSSGPKYKCLKEVFRIALNLVLDHFFNNCGGYTLSPAEKRRHALFFSTGVFAVSSSAAENGLDRGNESQKHATDMHSAHDGNEKSMSVREEVMRDGLFALNGSGNASLASDKGGEIKQQQEYIYQQRKQRLLNMLGCSEEQDSLNHDKMRRLVNAASHAKSDDGPPFTIQRIAEVLIAPERYYTRTHKLCNCLEKLLLVTSSTSAFGGSTGGDTSQSRREETELAALADEKGRVQLEFRHNQRRLRRKTESPLSDDAGGNDSSKDRFQSHGHQKRQSSFEKKNVNNLSEDVMPGAEDDDDPRRLLNSGSGNGAEDESREMLEAAARASLRTKFDHVGIDPHSSAAVNGRDARSMAENRGMTNSPPPPSLGMAGSPGIGLAGTHSGLLRHGHGSPTSPTSPKSDKSGLVRTPSPIFGEGSSPPMAPLHSSSANMHLLQMHHAAAMAGMSTFELMALNASDGVGVGSTAPGTVQALPTKDMDVESRSSASSDVDSESDVSFDDSASDRSDGSDSGQHYEPLTAARAMALNRMQQQQRLQSRVLTSLQQHGSGEGFRPPADSEYQSGDSIDSTRAEDSGGSDSSSSDLAD